MLTQMSQGMNSSSPNTWNQDALEMAGKMLEKLLQSDASFPSLLDVLCVAVQGGPTVSGLNDHDYPSLDASAGGLASLKQLSTIKKIPLPAELVEHFGHMQCNCMMGLFPEVGRAWLAIDSDIYVWTYEDGGDLAYFDGLSETILSVGLLKPKPGIFHSHIQFLLCLTTPVEIVLLGVSFSRPREGPTTGYDEMHLLPEPLFSLPTDSTYMVTVVGTSNGRVFMGGKDGCLYELVYQAEDGWFSRKCRKVNHSTSAFSFLIPSFLNMAFSEEDPIVQISIDDSRNIMYTRSEKGTIQVLDLGIDGMGMVKVAALSQHSIVQNTMLIAKTIDRSNFWPIINISAVDATESLHIHLVVVTQAGVRLYFTTVMLNNPIARPCTLQLISVRLPPGFAANATPQRPNKVHMAYYKKGTLLLAASPSEEADVLWTISGDSFPFQPQLMETQNTTVIDGHTWALAEIPTKSRVLVTSGFSVVEPPLVVTQHMQFPRKFVLLSAQGAHIITKMRPVDHLRQLLVENNGPDCESVKAYFTLRKDDQACGTCLILACNQSVQESQVCEWATRAFFLYGGEPKLFYPVHGGQTQPSVSPTSTSGKYSFSFYPRKVSTPNDNYPTGVTDQQTQTVPAIPSGTLGPEVQFSGKHNGLYLYFGRVVRPLWFLKAVTEMTVKTIHYLTSSVSCDEVGWILSQLHALRDFMERNSQFTTLPYMENPSVSQHVSNLPNFSTTEAGQMTQVQKKYLQEAQHQEKQSLINLKQLIGHTCQVLGLWKVLCDHQFHILAQSLSKDFQNQLRMLNFRDLVLAGQDIYGALINSLINRYLGDNATTDAISNRLREVCPTLYRNEDAICSKANEILLNARNQQNRYEKEKMLKEALKLCKQITPQLNLPAICHHFQASHFYDGIVDLCLTAATKRDPQGLAAHYYKNNEPADDHQGLQAYISRMECYKQITEVLGQLLTLSASHPQSPSVPRTPGPPPPPDPNKLSPSEAREYAEQVFQMGLQSSDEVFHMSLYTWLVDKQLYEKLLEIRSPHLEEFLKRASGLHPDVLTLYDLLWKYYEKKKDYSSAANILARLSDRHSTELQLPQRIEYLSRAIMCVKSAELSVTMTTHGEFLHELEEKMEVARIQLQVLESVRSLSGDQNSISRLNSGLLDITLLFEDFAERFRLWECKLAIVHCAGHYDPTLIENIWSNILEIEMKKTLELPSQTRITTISNKIKSLGKLYSSSQKYFPLDFLVKQLEVHSCQLNYDLEWVFMALESIGISLTKLHEVYHRLYSSHDPIWLTKGKPHHLLYVLYKLIAFFVDSPDTVSAHERRQFTELCLDAVSGYLGDLYCRRDTEVLVGRFRSVQAKLERL